MTYQYLPSDMLVSNISEEYLLQETPQSTTSTYSKFSKPEDFKHKRSSARSRYSPYHKHSSSKRTNQDLFLEGFQDCASEVVRFLKEDMKLNESDQFLGDLQSHLLKVSKVICNEDIAHIDNTSSLSQADNTHVSADSPGVYPVLPRSNTAHSPLSEYITNSLTVSRHPHQDSHSLKSVHKYVETAPVAPFSKSFQQSCLHCQSHNLKSSTKFDQSATLLLHSTGICLCACTENSSQSSYSSSTDSKPSGSEENFQYEPADLDSALVSGNFANILLGIESCQQHSDPKIRALAAELVNLIHDNGIEDENTDTDLELCDNRLNEKNTETGYSLNDSGIDLGDNNDEDYLSS